MDWQLELVFVFRDIGGGGPARIAAQVVSGIGFLGAGAILPQDDRISGLTTAGTPWATAAVGLGMGFGMYLLASCAALLILGLLLAHDHPLWPKLRAHHHADSDSRSNGTR